MALRRELDDGQFRLKEAKQKLRMSTTPTEANPGGQPTRQANLRPSDANITEQTHGGADGNLDLTLLGGTGGAVSKVGGRPESSTEVQPRGWQPAPHRRRQQKPRKVAVAAGRAAASAGRRTAKFLCRQRRRRSRHTRRRSGS